MQGSADNSNCSFTGIKLRVKRKSPFGLVAIHGDTLYRLSDL